MDSIALHVEQATIVRLLITEWRVGQENTHPEPLPPLFCNVRHAMQAITPTSLVLPVQLSHQLLRHAVHVEQVTIVQTL